MLGIEEKVGSRGEMAFGLEDSFQPDLLEVLQVTMTGFVLGMVIIAIHKIIKKYKLDE